MVDLAQDLCQKRHTPQQAHAVGAVDLRVEGGEQQQLLAGEGGQLSQCIHGAQLEVQGRGPLLDLDVLGPAAQDGGDVPLVPGGDDLPHALAEHQHGVQVLVQKGVDAVLATAHRHLLQKLVQRRLGLLVPALCLHAAAQPDDLVDAGVHQGQRLPDGPVQLGLPLL